MSLSINELKILSDGISDPLSSAISCSILTSPSSRHVHVQMIMLWIIRSPLTPTPMRECMPWPFAQVSPILHEHCLLWRDVFWCLCCLQSSIQTHWLPSYFTLPASTAHLFSVARGGGRIPTSVYVLFPIFYGSILPLCVPGSTPLL